MSSYQAHCDAVSKASLFVDSFGLHSSLGDIFTHLLALTTYISHRLVRFIGESCAIIGSEIALLVPFQFPFIILEYYGYI
jgi:hypothetical protein